MVSQKEYHAEGGVIREPPHRRLGAAARAFLENKFEDKNTETYFSVWSPYKIKRTRVKFLPLRSIPRPSVDLEGIKGTFE